MYKVLRPAPVLLLGLLAVTLLPGQGLAATLPTIQLGLTETSDPKQMATIIEILLVFTVLSMAPALLLMTTSFTRLVVAFSFLKSAMGTQQMPPSQVLIALSLFLSLFIMSPVFSQMNTTAVQPYMAEEIGLEKAFTEGIKPLRAFMFKQTRQKDLALFLSFAKMEKPQNKEEIPTTILLPAFMISELKTAFQIGFILFLPFLVVDMVVASVLLSMGMMMLPPVMVSLPFKLLLFVLVDGWYLIVGSLVKSFGV
ncbi:MAG: flagellar type III secretion system pore protein FliP [Desulfurivibrionaceae bacterium]|nr:flagellar type III secretion system pore protein FliP [Desulfurivibrionaceae bacterium]